MIVFDIPKVILQFQEKVKIFIFFDFDLGWCLWTLYVCASCLVQEEDLLLAQEEDLLLVQEDLLPVEEDFVLLLPRTWKLSHADAIGNEAAETYSHRGVSKARQQTPRS